ncbi:regulator of protease activity HflC (stomatin/prohibitin superfamily) [Nocardioides luteus]|nr:DUF4041 domain-containing protein [Nocardioides luteus]MDR7312014.1 regulator of protease activity HflC (stomatin/prohibitin superfamily) [Nocardioides luteus]
MPKDWQLWVPEGDTAPPETGSHFTVASNPSVAQVAARPPTSVFPLEPPERPPGEHQPAPPAFSEPTPPITPVPPPTDSSALLRRIAELEAALARADGSDIVDLNDQRVLQDVGIYRYHHPLEDAAAYKDRLTDINVRIDELVKANRAVLAADLFTFDGSLARGRKMVTDLSKLMLRAYNAEADNCVRSLRHGNISTAKKRLEKSMKSIERLGLIMEMRVNPDYHQLRVEELELTADYQMKVQEEKEQAREERARLREQRKAEQELAAERERLDKEKAHYEGVLQQLRAKGDNTAADELASRLTQIEKAIEANDYRAANIRAGYIYVISNIGALGPNIVKIGMTRRLEPRDRVRELGDASVPFLYDTHALFFSDDAVTLENELHKAFADRRVNFVNERREFFFATPAEVRELLMEKVGGLLEFNETPEAPEYFQSRGRWRTHDR